MDHDFEYLRVDVLGKISDLYLDFEERDCVASGSLATNFRISEDVGFNGDFLSQNSELWKIEPNSANYFYLRDESKLEHLLAQITNHLPNPENLTTEILDDNWLAELPKGLFQDAKFLIQNHDSKHASRIIVVNKVLYGIFYESEVLSLVPMDASTECTHPILNKSIASFEISWDNMVSGTDYFNLLTSATGRYFIFCNLDERENQFIWLNPEISIEQAMSQFLNFLKSGEYSNLSLEGLSAMVHDLIEKVDEEHFELEHGGSKNYQTGQHYFGLQSIDVELHLDTDDEVLKRILDRQLQNVNQMIRSKIVSGLYCFETQRFAAPTTFSPEEIEILDSLESYPVGDVSSLEDDYFQAHVALINRPLRFNESLKLLRIESYFPHELLKRVNECISNDPDHEVRYWEAYWILREDDSNSRLEIAKKNLELGIEIQRAQEILSWPRDWDKRFAPLWLRLGGSSRSVSSWHSNDWKIEEIFFKVILNAEWNGGLRSRVKNVNAPKKILLHNEQP